MRDREISHVQVTNAWGCAKPESQELHQGLWLLMAGIKVL